MDERQPKRSLVDDPTFLASLSELDRGLSGDNQEAGADEEPFPQPTLPRPPFTPRPVARIVPASITPPPLVQPITIAAPPPPLAAVSAPTPSAVSLPEPPPWLPPTAFAAINAASAALTAAFEPEPVQPPAAPSPAPPAGRAAGPRTLLDLFPPASREATAPGRPIREKATLPPPIAAVEPPRVTVRTRPLPAPAPALVDGGATYETFYGLAGKPFAAAPDLRFLYHSTAHDRALQELMTSIGRRDPVAVLTGEPGIGKTLLCRAVVDQLDRRTLVSFVSSPIASPDDLLKTLLVDFGVISPDDLAKGGLAAASHDDLAKTLRDFLGSLTRLQAWALLIVDNAHTLPGAVLRELRRLSDAAGAGLLEIVLVGEAELISLLRTNDLRALDEHVKVRAALDPLEADEVPGYVAHRLAVAGRGERVEFGEPALEQIFELSDGIPGLVNQICDRALVLGYQASASHIDDDLVQQAAEQAGLLAAEGAGSWSDRALVAMLLIVLMLAGAAGAGWVFREPLGRVVSQFSTGPR